MKERLTVIAIDGPAGAGKSTVAKRLAQDLGLSLIDTGAMFRAVALAAERAGVAWSDADKAGQIAEKLSDGQTLIVSTKPGESQDTLVVLEGEDVSSKIRAPNISQGASQVSAHPKVRAALLALQRKLVDRGGVVLEGRDTGTVVAPSADFKFFVTASPEVRAKRRCNELAIRGVVASFEITLNEIKQRDLADSTRTIAPLKPAPDATIVDTSDLDINQVVGELVERVKRKISREY